MSNSDIPSFLKTCFALKPDELKVSELNWRFAMRAILRGDNLMFRGDHGGGKTMFAQIISEVTTQIFPSRQSFYFNMGSMQDPRASLIGNTHFNKDKGTYVTPALFIQAIQTPGAVILLDEVSRAHPDAHNILMTVLDKRQRYIRIDEDASIPEIRVAEGVTFLGTANMGTEYTATRTVDRAFMDRWEIIMIDPLSYQDEFDLLRLRFPSVRDVDLSAIAKIADDTRSNVRSDDPRVDTIVSTRMTVQMAELIMDGFTLQESAEVCVFPFYSDAGGTDSPRSYMLALVQRFIPPAPRTSDPDTYDPDADLNSGAALPYTNA
jgi:MoxR-like ATPase